MAALKFYVGQGNRLMLKKLLIVVPILVVFLMAMAFGAQNSQTVSVNFLVFKSELSLAAVAGIFLTIGFVLSLAVYVVSVLRWRLRYRRLLNKLKKAERNQLSPDAKD